MFEKIKTWYKNLPDSKKHIEFFTAILSVPVLMTVLLINLSNLINNKKEPLPTPTPIEKIVVMTNPVSPSASSSPTFTPTALPECRKEVGPVIITSPVEGQLINKDPVCLKIDYMVIDYCSVVYSYKIDKGDWSEYTDKQICLYNLEPGPKTLELRVKSSQSDDEVILIRNFYYKTKDLPRPTEFISPSS